jgi:hypothetical protein
MLEEEGNFIFVLELWSQVSLELPKMIAQWKIPA